MKSILSIFLFFFAMQVMADERMDTIIKKEDLHESWKNYSIASTQLLKEFGGMFDSTQNATINACYSLHFDSAGYVSGLEAYLRKNYPQEHYQAQYEHHMSGLSDSLEPLFEGLKDMSQEEQLVYNEITMSILHKIPGSWYDWLEEVPEIFHNFASLENGGMVRDSLFIALNNKLLPLYQMNEESIQQKFISFKRYNAIVMASSHAASVFLLREDRSKYNKLQALLYSPANISIEKIKRDYIIDYTKTHLPKLLKALKEEAACSE
jgi:hypothetical protein